MYTLTAKRTNGLKVYWAFNYGYAGQYPKWTEDESQAVFTDNPEQAKLWMKWAVFYPASVCNGIDLSTVRSMETL